MRDHKDHRRRLGAKNDVSTISSAIKSRTYTAPDMWKMVHGFGKGGRKDVRDVKCERERNSRLPYP